MLHFYSNKFLFTVTSNLKPSSTFKKEEKTIKPKRHLHLFILGMVKTQKIVLLHILLVIKTLTRGIRIPKLNSQNYEGTSSSNWL